MDEHWCDETPNLAGGDGYVILGAQYGHQIETEN